MKELKNIKKQQKKVEKALKKEYKIQKQSLKADFKREREEGRKSYLEALRTAFVGLGKKPPVDPPKRPLLEEIGNFVTHTVGAALSVMAFIFMLLYSRDTMERMGAIMYFIGLFLLFTMSSLYHAFPHGSTVKRVFRRFDYLSIYLLIGATFAPILLAYVGGIKGNVFFIIQWVIIITGVTFISVFGPTKLKWLHNPLYLVLGWSGLMLIPELLSEGVGFFAYIVGGGVIYTLGIIPFAMKRGPAHFIWHFFVLAGAAVQWIGIFNYVYLR